MNLVLVQKECKVILKCSIITLSSTRWLDSSIFFFCVSFSSFGLNDSPNTEESCWLLIMFYKERRMGAFPEWSEGRKCHFSAVLSWQSRHKVLFWHLLNLSFSLYGPLTLVLNFSLEFMLCAFHNILWINWCIIYSLSTLMDILQSVGGVYSGIMGFSGVSVWGLILLLLKSVISILRF